MARKAVRVVVAAVRAEPARVLLEGSRGQPAAAATTPVTFGDVPNEQAAADAEVGVESA